MQGVKSGFSDKVICIFRGSKNNIMNGSISMLLGAGFSAPQGYPVGNTLNDNLLNCTGEDFAFHTSGVLCSTVDGKKPNFGYKTSYDFEFDFCRDLIKHFHSKKGYFDYEEFYDYFILEAEKDEEARALFNLNRYGADKEFEQMVRGLRNIYTQLVSHYLVDREGNRWYDKPSHMGGPIWPGYTGILNCFKKLGEKYTVNVHTLNHDLFFERLSISDWFQGELSDGFEELGSPYYGKLETEKGLYRCRLEHYTGKYEKKFRLYKLHGSRNYGIYYSSEAAIHRPENYLKTKVGIGFGDLLKEKKNHKGELEYERCWINYHADFLTGTTSKIERYKEPILYKRLFELFRKNLSSAETLIIIGYGGKDSEVNKILLENFDSKNKSSYIIDPFAGAQVEELAAKLNSSLIKKDLESIQFSDIGI